jgi:hypothetical protein
MKKVIDIRSIARPINLNNRQERIDKRTKEIKETHEKLKKQAQEIFTKKYY